MPTRRPGSLASTRMTGTVPRCEHAPIPNLTSVAVRGGFCGNAGFLTAVGSVSCALLPGPHAAPADSLDSSADVALNHYGEELVIQLLVIVGVVVAVLFGWPLSVLLADMIWLVVAMVSVCSLLCLPRRPWPVEV